MPLNGEPVTNVLISVNIWIAILVNILSLLFFIIEAIMSEMQEIALFFGLLFGIPLLFIYFVYRLGSAMSDQIEDQDDSEDHY